MVTELFLYWRLRVRRRHLEPISACERKEEVREKGLLSLSTPADATSEDTCDVPRVVHYHPPEATVVTLHDLN